MVLLLGRVDPIVLELVYEFLGVGVCVEMDLAVFCLVA